MPIALPARSRRTSAKAVRAARKIAVAPSVAPTTAYAVPPIVPAFPFFLVNLVPAFLGVPTKTYVLATLIGIIPGGFVFASVGAGLGSIFDQEGDIGLADVMTFEIILAMIGLGVLALLPVVAKRFFGRNDGR